MNQDEVNFRTAFGKLIDAADAFVAKYGCPCCRKLHAKGELQECDDCAERARRMVS